jgi:hypothetical protein
MAVEVRESKYLFHTPVVRKRSDIKTLPPFQHNCLHDLESTWWIGLWMTYVFGPTAPSEEDVIHFQQLFPPPHALGPHTSGVAPLLIHGNTMLDFSPQQNQPIFDAIWEWKYDLYRSYAKLENHGTDQGKLDESAFQYVHDEALGNLNGLLAILEKGYGRASPYEVFAAQQG